MSDQAGILTITLNPALDLATSVDHVIPGPKLRCRQPRFDPGGGGVNVARAVCKIGGAAQALVAVGGAMGDRLLALLAEEHVPTLPVAVTGETRQSFAVTDESTGGQFRFSVPGQVLDAADGRKLMAAIVEHVPPKGLVVFSGSVAPGLSNDFPNQIIAAAARKTAKVIIDTSSAALERLITQPTAPARLLRLDHTEAVIAAGRPLNTVTDTIAFANDLIARGVAELVVIGHGAEGSLLVSNASRFFCHSPVVKVRSKIGAGDAFVGSMTLALARGQMPDQALRWGVAAACATVETEGTALCSSDEAKARFSQCQLEEL